MIQSTTGLAGLIATSHRDSVLLRGSSRVIRLTLVAALITSTLGIGHRAFAAERPEESWANLNLLKPGQHVRVIRTNLKSVDGAFASCSDETITVRANADQVSIPRAEVFRVTLQERSHRVRNMLIGMAAGAGAGLAIGAIVDSRASESGEHLGKTIFTPIGLGAGAGIGAATGGAHTVYRGKLPAR